MAAVIIDDGTREYVIQNRFGKEIARIHFRPADFSILDRYDAMKNSFTEIIRPLQEISINADGTAAEDAGITVLRKADRAFKEMLNRLLDADDADEIFRTRNPFASVGGRFFAENVLDAVGQLITQAFEEESKASAERMSKYTVQGGEPDVGAASF